VEPLVNAAAVQLPARPRDAAGRHSPRLTGCRIGMGRRHHALRRTHTTQGRSRIR